MCAPSHFVCGASGWTLGSPSAHALGWAIQSSWTNGGRSGLLPRPIRAIFKHFSLGDHQDRLASSLYCFQALSMSAHLPCFAIPLGKITLGDAPRTHTVRQLSRLLARI